MIKETAALEALRMCRRFYPWRAMINDIRVLYRHNVPASTPVALGLVESWAMNIWRNTREYRKKEAARG